jgi:hypothetical protein
MVLIALPILPIYVGHPGPMCAVILFKKMFFVYAVHARSRNQQHFKQKLSRRLLCQLVSIVMSIYSGSCPICPFSLGYLHVQLATIEMSKYSGSCPICPLQLGYLHVHSCSPYFSQRHCCRGVQLPQHQVLL